ncbi:MAG: hypothetical protein U0802_22150 [Candidatus Binatia bacterium]
MRRPAAVVSGAAAGDGRRARRAAWLVGGLAFVASLSNLRPMGTGDTTPARLAPFSLLREGNLDLDEFAWLRAPELARPYFLQRDRAGRWRSKYPVATPLVATPLAAPFACWARARGLDDGDARFRLLTAVVERVAAALIGALSVALVMLAASAIAPPGWAAAAALFYAFGTPTWVYSQALWQHGLAEVGIAGAALCLLRPATRRRSLAAGAWLALALAARPTTIVLAPLVALAVWRQRRDGFWAFAAAYASGAALQAIYNLTVLSRSTGGYSTRAFGPPNLDALLGVLVSPSRGLLWYCPLALLALGALARGTRPPLLRILALALPAYAAFFACARIWWGGFSYGPRFFTDVMPLVVLCALPVARRWWRHRGGRAVLVAGAAWCVVVQAVGVYCDDQDWNTFPVAVDRQTERLWAWSDPQILRAVRSGWHGWDFAPLLWQLATDPRPAPLVPLDRLALAGTIEAVTPPPWRCQAGRNCRVEVRVSNRSAASTWPAYTDHGVGEVGIGAFWRMGDVVEAGVGGFIPMRRQLGAGDAARVPLVIDAPARAGSYQLELVVVQNLGATGGSGGASTRVPVLVE